MQCEIHKDTLHTNKNSGLSENDEKEEVPCSGSLLKEIVLSTTDVQEIMTCLETIREREQRISNLLQRAAVNKEFISNNQFCKIYFQRNLTKL